MKRLLKIGCANFIMSLFPVLSWYVLAFCFKDGRWTNCFLAGYNQQFVWLIIHGIIVSGTIKWAYKNGKDKAGYIEGSIIISTLFMFVESLFVIINIDRYLNFFKLDEFYKTGVYVYVLYLTIEMLFYGISKYMNYRGRDSEVLKATVVLYSIRIFGVLILSLFIKSVTIVLSISVTLTCVYCLWLYSRWIGFRHKVKFKPFIGAYLEIPNDIGKVFMLIIYIFGVSSLSSNGGYVAFNIMTLCTDAQWDAMSYAVDTYSTLSIIENKGKISKKLVINSVVFSFILLLSSFVMILTSSVFLEFSLRDCLIMFFLECALFCWDGYRYVYHSWLTLYYHRVLMSIIPIVSYIVRTVVSFSSDSIYALSFAVLVGSAINNYCYLWLYRRSKNKVVYLEQEVING